jgi:hypothetical protein
MQSSSLLYSQFLREGDQTSLPLVWKMAVCCGYRIGCILAPFIAEPMNCSWCVLVFRSRYDLTMLEPFTPTALFHCSLLHPSPQQEGFGYTKVVLISWNRIYCNNIRHIIDSQTQQFITLCLCRATCFDSLESSSGPPLNLTKTI